MSHVVPYRSLLFLALVFPLSLQADNYPRDHRVDVVDYVFRLSLSDGHDRIQGHATVTCAYTSDGEAVVTLDLASEDKTGGMKVERVTQDGNPVSYRHRENRLTINPAGSVRKGASRVFDIYYAGTPRDGLVISRNKHGERTFFGDNWPNRAHHWLPCVDHPSDKATCSFEVTAPNHYQVVANGLMQEKVALSEGRSRTRWASPVPMPTKVMVIGVAHFAVEILEGSGGIPFQNWVFPSEREAGFQSLIQARAPFEWLVKTVGPFPYSKIAHVQSKTRYGGMENASAIFYNQNVFQPGSEPELLFAHELAHQWFGDSVTEADWHHIWLSEGFATYYTMLYAEAAYGRERLVPLLEKSRQRVLDYTKTEPALSVVDPSIKKLDDLLSPFSYQKGGWVLHMLRREVGEQAFREGVRAYYARYRNSNAFTKDFRKEMETASGKDLGWFFQQWLFRPGHPKLKGHWRYDRQRKELHLVIKQKQTTPFRFTLDLGVSSKTGSQTLSWRLKKQHNEKVFPLSEAPQKILLDPDLWLLFEGKLRKK